MTDDPVEQALAELQDLVRCRCHPAYTGRGLRDPDCECDSTEAVKAVADRIEALTEQLAAAQHDAKEAEAYAEELEAKLATCEKYRDAYAECDRIGTQAVRDLEAKLEKLIGGAETVLEAWDSGNEAPFREAIEELRADVAEAKGGKDAESDL